MAKLSRLYESDETGWLEQMSKLIKERRYGDLDYKHLNEFLLDMAKRDRREVFSRLKTLLIHVLKWQYQPRKRSRSWEITLMSQRDDLRDLLQSKTLRNHALEVLSDAYARAVRYASKETDLPEERFPRQCPYALDELLSEE